MSKILNKLNNLSLPAVILIASIILGGFYFASQINKQRSIERQQQIKINQEKQEQLAEQKNKEEAKKALNDCIASAEKSYSNQWYKECKALGKLTSECIELKEMTYEEYKEQNPRQDNEGLDTRALDFYKKRDDCSCRLPSYNADNINESLEENKKECFKKYPQK